MIIFTVLVGVALLILGRQLFWLFVAGAGFVIGMALASHYLQTEHFWVVFVIALLAGIAGAILAVFLEGAAIGIAGFIGGAYIAVSLVNHLSQITNATFWIAFVVGGIIGLALIISLFDWALIFLSSIIGSALIVQAIGFVNNVAWLLFVILFVIGFAVQAGMYRQNPPQRSANSRT